MNRKRSRSETRVLVLSAQESVRADLLRQGFFFNQAAEVTPSGSRRNTDQLSRGLRNIDPKSRTGPENGKALDYKIMVVDDEKKIADLYSIILKSAGFTVDRIAHDGIEAIDALDLRHPPDVILMDQKMPRMDGLEASRKIKEMNPKIKIIMITAYDVPRESYGFLSLILAKPISKRQLLQAIESV